MPEAAQEVLMKLLSRGERAGRRRLPSIAARQIAGYPFRSIVANRAFHEQLALAAERGAVELDWKPGYVGHDLQRIRLTDVAALAQFLGRPLLADRVEEVFASLAVPTAAPEWLSPALDLLRERWLEGKPAFGLSVDDAESLAQVCTAIAALSQIPDDRPMDYRQFGARFLGDSKLPRVIGSTLASLLSTYEGRQGRNAEEILGQYNLVPIAQPVLLHGPLRFSDGARVVDAAVRPHVGVPAAVLERLTVETPPRYVLSIENQSSFNGYTEAVDDGGVVLYTAGFPTQSFQRFYRELVRATAAPLYHWGDTDAGGFRILKVLQGLAPRPVLPHLMTGEGGGEYSVRQLSQLKAIGSINLAADALIARMLEVGVGLLEQEATEPRSPLEEAQREGV